MLLGVIADDFTGASDIANTLTKGCGPEGGLRTALFQGVPEGAASTEVEAGVVALKSRSIPPKAAVAQSLHALEWLLSQGCRQIVFKYCSTFDSTPEGNIGPVAEALAQRLSASGIVVCPAFPEAGRTVYQGHLFVQDRLLNESGMQNHPLNPMTDPDLRRWLRRQASGAVGLVPWQVVAKGPDAIATALAMAAEGLVIVDALSVADLVAIGRANAKAPLLTGGSGIAAGLPANFIAEGQAAGYHGDKFSGQVGRGAIFAGSCSGATRGQVDYYRKAHPSLLIDVDAVMSGAFTASDVVAFVSSQADEIPLVYSSGTPEQVSQMQDRHGREAVAEKLDHVFGQAAVLLRQLGLQRLVVAGGETSGAVVSTLNLGAMMIGPEIDPGVPALEVAGAGAAPLALALKSGNFGTPDFFEKAMERLSGR